nr:MAG TPA: hypothetical protein [Caudoviricetes sp.]
MSTVLIFHIIVIIIKSNSTSISSTDMSFNTSFHKIFFPIFIIINI